MLPDVRIESATVCIPGGRASDRATAPDTLKDAAFTYFFYSCFNSINMLLYNPAINFQGIFNGSNTNVSTLDGSPVCADFLSDYLPPLWQTDFVVAVVYCVLLGVSLFLGAFGNLIILIINSTTRIMNRVAKDFIINLAVADLCVALIADPMCILGNVY